MPVYPIGFSIPESKIVSEIPPKTKRISDLIPGVLSTYIYQTEEDYYKEYQSSVFAKTTKKAGWDCMRHYEILAQGCIPFFPALEHCPPNTMTFFPKELVLKANKIYQTDDDPGNLAEELLDYTRNNLTTKKMAQYILDKSGNSQAKTILFLSGDVNPDYLRCITLQGFKELFGSMCHDYPKITHIYKEEEPYNHLYGKGITYTNNIEQTDRNNLLDNTILKDIEQQKYDIVIYGSYHRHMIGFDLIKKHYPPNKVILLCGEDLHACDYRRYSDVGYTVFVREL
jgi:hypothetical protein